MRCVLCLSAFGSVVREAVELSNGTADGVHSALSFRVIHPINLKWYRSGEEVRQGGSMGVLNA